MRGGKNETLAVTREATTGPREDFGFALKSGVIFTHPTPWRQIARNAEKTFAGFMTLVNPRSDLGLAHLSGPIGIIRNFFDLAQEGLPFALWFTILVNVNLAIFNLLPIPVLDGGHIVFATLAKLRGRALPPNLIATTQSVFIVLLFTMILYVSVFDVRRIVRDTRTEAPPPTAEPAKP
jgi:regulator of sigma E protease